MKIKGILILSIIVLIYVAGCGTKPIDPLTTIDNQERISAEALAEQVSEDNLRSNVNNIFNVCRYWQHERNSTFSSIEAEVTGLNYTIATQEFFSNGLYGRNLVLTKNGIITPNKWIVIMAHYDTVYDSPGADDNGSGCSGLLEIAKIISNVTFESTLKLVFVDLEEWGMLGSQYFVSQIPMGTNILAAVSMEMLGFTSHTQQNPFPAPFDINTGDFLAVIGDGKSFSMANDFVRNLKQNNISLPTIIISPDEIINNRIFQDFLRSDHAMFWAQGYPAIMITDTANYRNPNYHKISDSISTLDFTFLKKATQSTLLSAYFWASPVNVSNYNPNKLSSY